MLLKEPVVAYPAFSVPFRLYTDASNIGLGVIFAQKRRAGICCASRKLNKSEQNYRATKKECLAVVWGIKNLRNYVIANHFWVHTDHCSLQWLRSMKNEFALLHRWAAQMEDYNFEILHKPGKNQGHVDALIKLPVDKVQFLGPGKTVLQTAEGHRSSIRVNSSGRTFRIKKTGIFRRSTGESSMPSHCFVMRRLPAWFELETLSSAPRKDRVGIPLGCFKHRCYGDRSSQVGRGNVLFCR